MAITITARAIDGFSARRTFKTLAGAQRFAQERVGETPEFGAGYAVAADGVVKVSVSGCKLADLFPATAQVDEAAARRWVLTARKVDGGRAYAIFEGTSTVALATLTVKSPEGYDVIGGFTCERDEELADGVNYVLRERSRERLDLRAKLAIVRECYDALGDQRARESAAELYAENAWLRAAEAPTNDDLGFEAYEAARLGAW